MNIAESGGITFALYLLALSVAVHAATMLAARPKRQSRRDLLAQLKAHNAAIDELLETEEGRATVATMVVNESALMGFIHTISEVAASAPNPIEAAQAEAKKSSAIGKIWGNVKNLGKPVAEAVFGKINSYIKSRFGVPVAE